MNLARQILCRVNLMKFYLKGNIVAIGNIENAIIEGHEILIAPIAYYKVKLCNYLLEEFVGIYIQ